MKVRDLIIEGGGGVMECMRCGVNVRAICVECHDETENELYDKIEKLRQLVWLQDIPNPTTPEYKEFHYKIQKILKFIDVDILDRRSEE